MLRNSILSACVAAGLLISGWMPTSAGSQSAIAAELGDELQTAAALPVNLIRRYRRNWKR